MSEINANIVVEPYDLTVSTNNNQIVVTPTALNMNIFTNDSSPGGFPGDLQYNANGVLGGIPTANYASGNLNLGSSSNLKIAGGANAYFLQTDGTGNLTWAPGTANVSGNGTSAGANNEIQLTDGSGNFKAAPGFTFDTGANLFTVPGAIFGSGNANILGNLDIGNNANILGNLDIGNNANIIGNVQVNDLVSNNNVVANANVQGTYIIGNGYYLTGISIDTTQISNGNSNVKVYSNTINFGVNGNANLVVMGPTTDIQVNAGMNVTGPTFLNGLVTTGFSGLKTEDINLGSNNRIKLPINTPGGMEFRGNGSYTFYMAGPSGSNVPSMTINPIVTYFRDLVDANRFQGNGYLLTNINAANIVGNVTVINANYSNFAGQIINSSQPNITSVGTLTNLNVAGNIDTANLTVNNNIAGDANFKFNPNSQTLNTAIGSLAYVQVANLGNTSTKTNTAVVFGDQGNGYSVSNDVFANIGGNLLYVGSHNYDIVGGTTTDKAAPSIMQWSVFDTNSDIANAVNSTGTSLQLSGGIGVVRGAPLDNTGVISSFSYGGNTDPTNSVGYRMTRRRGNGAARLSLQPNDYLGNIEWRGAQANGTLPTGNRFAKIGAKVDSTYVANIAAQPVGLEFVVVNSTANITHSFYSNGVVSFAGNVNASNFVGNFVGNIGNANYANYAGTVLTNSQPNITSIGTLTSLNVTNKIIAGQLQGDGGNISNIQGANVSGQTGNALVAGTVYTNAQPNITSVGTLSSLIVSGNTQSNNFIANRLYQYGTNQLLIDGAGNANFTALTVSSQNVTIGSNAGSNSQGQFAIAIGNGAGKNSQGNYSIAIGSNAGISGQHDNTIILNATGLNLFSQLANSTYIAPIRQFTGPNVLYFSPSTKEITYGPSSNAGSSISNGTSNVNIATANGNITFGVAGSANVMVVTGTEANVNVLRTRETRVVLGNNAGSGLSFSSNSAVGVVLIGDSAGIGSGGTISNTAIAVGSNAGAGGFGQFDGIAIGANAGSLGNTLSAAQGNAIAIGVNAGQGALNSDTIAIGTNSGYRLQNYSIAIGSGAGNTQPGNNTIILNATGSSLTQTTANSLTIKPIRNARNDQTLVYDPTSGEVTYTNYVKTISTTVASLVAANTVGAGTRAFVTDANTTTFLAIVGGGGANKVPVVSDGTNWIVG